MHYGIFFKAATGPEIRHVGWVMSAGATFSTLATRPPAAAAPAETAAISPIDIVLVLRHGTDPALTHVTAAALSDVTPDFSKPAALLSPGCSWRH